MQNFPGRAAPIKEQTVLEYILEAGREGFVINWIRFSQEIGLTEDVHKWILSAISKVGKEKLKPIKNELPEEVISAYNTVLIITVKYILITIISYHSANQNHVLNNNIYINRLHTPKLRHVWLC